MSDIRSATHTQEPVMMCNNISEHKSYEVEPMQAHAVSSSPNMHVQGHVYVTVLYRCTVVKCRRTATVTTEIMMPLYA